MTHGPGDHRVHLRSRRHRAGNPMGEPHNPAPERPGQPDLVGRHPAGPLQLADEASHQSSHPSGASDYGGNRSRTPPVLGPTVTTRTAHATGPARPANDRRYQSIPATADRGRIPTRPPAHRSRAAGIMTADQMTADLRAITPPKHDHPASTPPRSHPAATHARHQQLRDTSQTPNHHARTFPAKQPAPRHRGRRTPQPRSGPASPRPISIPRASTAPMRPRRRRHHRHNQRRRRDRRRTPRTLGHCPARTHPRRRQSRGYSADHHQCRFRRLPILSTTLST